VKDLKTKLAKINIGSSENSNLSTLSKVFETTSFGNFLSKRDRGDFVWEIGLYCIR
jgi:hypothetical protein